jgi:hypothetical protein
MFDPHPLIKGVILLNFNSLILYWVYKLSKKLTILIINAT